MFIPDLDFLPSRIQGSKKLWIPDLDFSHPGSESRIRIPALDQKSTRSQIRIRNTVKLQNTFFVYKD